MKKLPKWLSSSNWSKLGWELQHWKALQQNYNESENLKYNKSNT